MGAPKIHKKNMLQKIGACQQQKNVTFIYYAKRDNAQIMGNDDINVDMKLQKPLLIS